MYAIKTNPRFGRPVVGLATARVATAALIYNAYSVSEGCRHQAFQSYSSMRLDKEKSLNRTRLAGFV